MSSFTKYAVITHTQLAQFIESVNDKIKDGWQPYGPFLCTNNNATGGIAQPTYYQAMVVSEELGVMRGDVKREHELP